MKISSSLAERIATHLTDNVANKRYPDAAIGADDPGGIYLLRWYLTNWRRWRAESKEKPTAWRKAKAWVARRLPSPYLHCFMRSDSDRAHHDHPSWAIALILRRGYVGHTIAAGGIHHRKTYLPGSIRFMRTTHVHRIELFTGPDGKPLECWTFFLFGPPVREWGFHCPIRGWVHWTKFDINKGCEE